MFRCSKYSLSLRQSHCMPPVKVCAKGRYWVESYHPQQRPARDGRNGLLTGPASRGIGLFGLGPKVPENRNFVRAWHGRFRGEFGVIPGGGSGGAARPFPPGRALWSLQNGWCLMRRCRSGRDRPLGQVVQIAFNTDVVAGVAQPSGDNGRHMIRDVRPRPPVQLAP